ncbi:MAG: FAD-binding oxidoreductase [Sphaerochaeta associata]|uniref:FAD-binding oxidoreductase n=1 Tax=Sphaerochaeta associata TaxID=1129264 RepID=UPI002B1FA23B|nr:FAD-binding oxidoreductase [Sphaerochaeta associata]MEA5107953.1 FAD-binding oxidoreductase [Sphaerochaeta associata]
MEKQAFMNDMILSELEDVVGVNNVSINEADKLSYGVDYFWVARMWVDKGQKPPQPDVIVRPDSAEQVSKILKIANYYKIPIHTWGGGSGSQGSALSMAGGIALDTKRMNRLLNLDEENLSIEAESGMIFQNLEWYANEKGYSVMHIPSCLTCGTIGGALAHRGIGIMSTKYGKIDDQCISLEIVLPNGDIINTLPVPKHAAGPDMNQIFIGSEGTLGIITKAKFKLVRQPEVRKFRAFLFSDFTTGLKACREIVQQIKPSIVRLFDEAETVSIIKNVIGFSKKGAFMNLAVEGIAAIVEIEHAIIMKICAKYGAEDLGSEYGEKWYENRITFFYPGHIMNNPQMFGTMDTAASYGDMEKIYWAMKKAVEKFEGVRFIAHCSHWYDWGTMLYDRFIMDNPPKNPREAIRLHNQIWNAGVRAAMENGGIINDHHGVGLKLSRLMKEQYGLGMQVFEGLKKSLDPNGIMNPYKLGL